MKPKRDRTFTLPRSLWFILALYALASLIHFVHNAQYLAFYPNFPTWITRDTVYWAWLVVTLPGVLALICFAMRWHVAGLLLLMIYGASGWDGLGHYAVALCTQHSLAQNATIWFEIITGTLLMALTVRAWIQSANQPCHG